MWFTNGWLAKSWWPLSIDLHSDKIASITKWRIRLWYSQLENRISSISSIDSTKNSPQNIGDEKSHICFLFIKLKYIVSVPRRKDLPFRIASLLISTLFFWFCFEFRKVFHSKMVFVLDQASYKHQNKTKKNLFGFWVVRWRENANSVIHWKISNNNTVARHCVGFLWIENSKPFYFSRTKHISTCAINYTSSHSLRYLRLRWDGHHGIYIYRYWI